MLLQKLLLNHLFSEMDLFILDYLKTNFESKSRLPNPEFSGSYCTLTYSQVEMAEK